MSMDDTTDPEAVAAPAPTAEPLKLTREQRRSRRKRPVRARTISIKRLTKRDLEIGRLLYPETGYYKPKTRGECADGFRPCPYVSCQHHLFLEVSTRTGAIKLNFPDLEVADMNTSCALDVADDGGSTLEQLGELMNLTRERVRQIALAGAEKLGGIEKVVTLARDLGLRAVTARVRFDEDDE